LPIRNEVFDSRYHNYSESLINVSICEISAQVYSPNGVKYNSLGRRPRDCQTNNQRALKGRHNGRGCDPWQGFSPGGV